MSAGPLQYCPRCGSRGWVEFNRLIGPAEWALHRGLCPICGGYSRQNLTEMVQQAVRESWWKMRYPGTVRAAWWPYDWQTGAFVENAHVA